MQGCRRLTSGFSFGGSSEVRVSRVFFSGPYQSCTRMRMQDVRGEMWPGAAVPRRPARRCRPPSQSCVCTHRACVRTALINEISTGTAPEVVLGLAAVASRVRRSGRAFGARWFRSRLGTLQSRAVSIGVGTRLRGVGCAVVQIRAICCRRLDGWRTGRPAPLATAIGSLVGEGAAGWVQRSWSRSRGWRETLRIAGGHRFSGLLSFPGVDFIERKFALRSRQAAA